MARIFLHKNINPVRKRENHYLTNSFYSESRVVEIDNTPIDLELESKKNYHIVSIGFIGLTYFSDLIKSAYNLTSWDILEHLQNIFDKKETGTLYPRYNLTILPFDQNPSYYYLQKDTKDKRNSFDALGYTYKEIENFVNDAFIAEIKYLKKGKMIFDFRDVDYDGILYNNAVINLLQNKYNELKIEVHLTSINNIEFISTEELYKYEVGYIGRERYFLERKNEQIKIKEKQNSDVTFNRKKKQKDLLTKFRTIDKEIFKLKQLELIEKYKDLEFFERLKFILNETNYPLEYFPQIWVSEIYEKTGELNKNELQEIYNRISSKITPKTCRELRKKIKKIEGIL